MGNGDKNSVVKHNLSPHIEARFLRLNPKTWKGHISMRMELYGCLKGELGLFMKLVPIYYRKLSHEPINRDKQRSFSDLRKVVNIMAKITANFFWTVISL